MSSEIHRQISSHTSHLQRYVGDYARTSDFSFQEQIRTADVAIKSIVQNILGAKAAQTFFVNGWGQIIAAAYLLNTNPSQLKISDTFKQILNRELDNAIQKTADYENPFNGLNVRAYSKPIMMHPTHPTHAGKYFDWKTVELETPVSLLNNFIKEASLEFTLTEGKLFLKINPEDESNIFNKLWGTDFPTLLQESGYIGLEKNNESPHITLVNSNVIATIREQFRVKYGNDDGDTQFTSFMNRLLDIFNNDLLQDENPICFTNLASTYSEDYPPFEEVLVAKLHTPCAERALNTLIKEIKTELGIEIPVRPGASFHLTIATKYRKPNPELPKDIQDILNHTGEHSDTLNLCWKHLQMSSN